MLFQTGPQIPPPRGLVNDFANVLPAASAAQIERIAQDVRDKSKGEIAVVTLSDLGGREPSEVALRIGREWKVGNLADIGDRSRNAGVVILIVPKETASDNRGRCRIETGRGAEAVGRGGERVRFGDEANIPTFELFGGSVLYRSPTRMTTIIRNGRTYTF